MLQRRVVLSTNKARVVLPPAPTALGQFECGVSLPAYEYSWSIHFICYVSQLSSDSCFLYAASIYGLSARTPSVFPSREMRLITKKFRVFHFIVYFIY
jgi:hypothetical protein